MIEIELLGGLRNGQKFEVEYATPTMKAPGAYEDSILVWREDHYVRSFPTEVYRRDPSDRYRFIYSHTEPA